MGNASRMFSFVTQPKPRRSDDDAVGNSSISDSTIVRAGRSVCDGDDSESQYDVDEDRRLGR